MTSIYVILVIVENGVQLRLNIVDTPGYGDQVNNEDWCATVIQSGWAHTYNFTAGIPL